MLMEGPLIATMLKPLHDLRPGVRIASITILACLSCVLASSNAWSDTEGSHAPAGKASRLQISAARAVADSGLIGYLIRQFSRENPGVHVHLQSVGALTALEHGYDGDADMVITHHPLEEERLVSLGYGRERVEFMHSEYAIFGPRQDTLQLATADSHIEVMQRLRDEEVDMFVPSPRSGTYARLEGLWASAGIDPDWIGYENTGVSALATLQQAATFEGYAIADMGLYLSNIKALSASLSPLYRDSLGLKNTISAIVMSAENNPGVNQALAGRFLDYLVSDAGQQAITAFSQQTFNEDIYVPSAHEDQLVINLQLLSELSEERRLRYLMIAVGTLLLLLAVTAVWFTRRVGLLERAKVVAEQERKVAELAEQAKSDFLATVSHEIRGPAGSIHNMAQLLRDSDLPNEPQRVAGVLHQSSERLLHTVSDVLDLSRMESGRLQLESVNLDLRELVGDLVTSLRFDAEASGLRLKCSIDTAIPAVLRGDPLRLQQILLNLVGNAIKFTEQGDVAVSVSLQQQDGNGCVLCWEVRDTGIGIAADQQQLFDRYVQADESTARRYGGSGLGLAICRQLVELMDGKIQVESMPGKGSTFSYTTRLAAADRQSKPGDNVTPLMDPVPVLCGRVLFVDDDSAIRDAGATLLKVLGCKVDTVGDGREAVAAVMQGGYDLVMLDCDLPVMDGYEAARTIRQWEQEHGDGTHLPIVALTGSVKEGIEQRCLHAGMDAYLAKPYRKEQLQKVLSRLLPATAGKEKIKGL